MTDLVNRTEFELTLAGKLGRAFTAQEKILLALLGDPPDINKVPPAFWTDMSAALVAALVPTLNDVYNASAEALSSGLPIGVDWSMVNDGAVRWVSEHAYETSKYATSNTRRAVTEAVNRYLTNQQTRGDLVRALTPSFGPNRAESIAVTEITRAASEGEQAIARELSKDGIAMIPYWETRNDEIVSRCPICWPRHGKPITDGKFPPGHIRCRCSTRYELPKVRR